MLKYLGLGLAVFSFALACYALFKSRKALQQAQALLDRLGQ